MLGEVEVFRTTIHSAWVGVGVLEALQCHFPTIQASLDLDDCDRILRIEAADGGPELWLQIVALVHSLGIEITALPD